MFNVFFKILKNNYRSFNDKEINMEELINLQNNGAVIIDIRNKKEHEEGHLKDDILLTDYELTKRKIYNKIPNKEQVIVLYCSTGSRSRKVQRKLNNLGYNNVYNLHGGIEEYY